jgi:hypothetical protein
MPPISIWVTVLAHRSSLARQSHSIYQRDSDNESCGKAIGHTHSASACHGIRWCLQIRTSAHRGGDGAHQRRASTALRVR